MKDADTAGKAEVPDADECPADVEAGCEPEPEARREMEACGGTSSASVFEHTTTAAAAEDACFVKHMADAVTSWWNEICRVFGPHVDEARTADGAAEDVDQEAKYCAECKDGNYTSALDASGSSERPGAETGPG